MGTKVIKLENWSHGGYRFKTTDPRGNKHGFHGVIHSLKHNEQIVRTFEMENSPFEVQLEFLHFEAVSHQNSMLIMHQLYRSVALRDQLLQFPFIQGIAMAHRRLEAIFIP